jgi:hypothetical protein
VVFEEGYVNEIISLNRWNTHRGPYGWSCRRKTKTQYTRGMTKSSLKE